MADQSQNSEKERFASATGKPVNLGKIDFKVKIDLSKAQPTGGKSGISSASPSQSLGSERPPGRLPQHYGSNLGAQMQNRESEEGGPLENSTGSNGENNQNLDNRKSTDQDGGSKKSAGKNSKSISPQKNQPDKLSDSRQNEASHILNKQRKELQKKRNKQKIKDKGNIVAKKAKDKIKKRTRNYILTSIGAFLLANIEWILLGGFVILTFTFFAVKYPRSLKVAIAAGNVSATLTLKAFQLFITTFGF